MSAAPHNETPRFTNRLAHESSPYLLQHAHNPVDWQPWGPDALEAARVQNKPIFLSVGYSACHWCHVMERESFENEAIAHLLNDSFISIKVDREERPDIDEIYMTAVQMMTGHGGWPMSVFLLPDGRPFYGGTYFPPDTRHGRIGFGSLVSQLADAYRTRREEVEQVAATVADDLRQAARQRPLATPVTPAGPLDSRGLLQDAVQDLAGRFDAANGGFGGAPKFPPHHALRLLLAAARGGQEEARRMALTTLEKMALGGIYDHVGGGFHRYATDAVWLLPHFEKMLYDNALLARLYAEAYELTGDAAYARVARETCDWVLRDMGDPAGGFHSALDADSEGEEGKYYVWKIEEVKQITGEALWQEFCGQYHILSSGNYREEATGNPTGANIPYLAVGASSALLPAELAPEVARSREALLARRYERVPPGKDDKVISAWNGLMIGALAFVGQALRESVYLTAARQAAAFCLATLIHEGTLLRRYARGNAGLDGFLDDHAYLADGLLDLYDATGEMEWVVAARALADTLLRDFWDAEDGGFFFAGNSHETLIVRSKDLFDGALPSANGVAARVLVRLGKLPEGERYAEAARGLLTAYRGVLHRAPSGTHTLILAAMDAFPEAIAEPFAPVRLSAVESMLRLKPGEKRTIRFALQIAEGFHVNARTPARPELIPTVATMTTDAPATAGPVTYPDATEWSSGSETLPVYQSRGAFTVPLAIASDAPPGRYSLTLSVRYQACSETECFPPDEHEVTVRIEIE